MKKIITVLVGMLILVGCGSSTDSYEFIESEILSKEDANMALKDPSNNKGKSLEFSGKIFNKTDEDEKFIYFQMYRDIVNYDDTTLVAIPKNSDFKVDIDDFVIGNGVIIGEFTGENAFGGKISNPAIQINTIKSGRFDETVAKAHTTYPIKVTQEQNGLEVEIEKIEFSDFDTRLFVNINNSGTSKTSIYSFNISMVANGKNYSQDSNYLADYPELDTDLNPNTSTEGIVEFGKINPDDFKKFKVIIERPYSSDYDVRFEDFEFDIEVQ